MTWRITIAAIAALFFAGQALAHGGGGGGGFIMVPIYLPAPQLGGAHPGDYSRIHSIAVISAIGDTVTLERPSYFSTATKSLDVRDWKIDDLVAAALKKYLGDRFSFKTAEYDRAALAAIQNGHFSVSTKPFAQFLTTVKSDGVDAYVVVRPDVEKDGRPDIQGIALLMGANSLPVLWFNYEIDIVDAHTLETLAQVTSRVQTRQGTVPSIPGFIMPMLLDLNGDLTPTPAQANLLHLKIVHDLPLTIVETLRPLALGIDLPAPGTRKLVPFPTGQAPYSNIHTVGIVSAIGDEIEFASVGSFGIGLDEKHIPARADWNIDGEIEGLMKNNLSPQFTVKDASETRAALFGATLFTSDGKARPTLTELPARDDIDAYLVVLKHSRNFHGMNCAGLDVCRFGALMHATNLLGLDCVIALVDAHTRAVLGWHWCVRSPKYATELPLQEVDDSFWPQTPSTASADQLVRIRSDLLGFIDDSVPETLLDMLLTGKTAASDFTPDGPDAPSASTVPDRGPSVH